MKNINTLDNYTIILGSASPRRKYLLSEMGIKFETYNTCVDETYPENMPTNKIPVFLSKKKSNYFSNKVINEKTIIITADTIVSLDNQIISKPKNKAEAKKFLKMLSGKMHIVYTGVTIKNKYKSHSFSVKSKVWFRNLKTEEIQFYINKYNPLDKAGAYGIQEWIGYIGIEKIEGSFFNVMGLPTSKLYEKLLEFVKD